MVLSATELTLGYRATPVVRDVSFALHEGDVLAVVGHNGCGKSTLVKTVLGTLAPVSGDIDWPQGRPNSIAYLGQQTEFDTRFPMRVRDLAEMGSWPSLGFTGRMHSQRRSLVKSALERAGIAHIADMPIHKLSAGQLQRTLFARTIVQDSPVILLDEPFTSVDKTTESDLLTLIDDWSSEGRTTLLVLHDLSAVLQHCTQALLMGKGSTTSGLPRETLTPQNLIDYGYLSASQAAWQESMYRQATNTHHEPHDV